MNLQETSILVGFALIFSSIVASYTKLKSTISETVKTEERCRKRVDEHMSDISIHRDPERDEIRWTDLMKHLDKMDGKIDAVLRNNK